MDAFALKARDQNANKAVFVTTAGFQSGAIAVAKRHGVDLFTVTFDETKIDLPSSTGFFTMHKSNAPKLGPPSLEIGEPTLVANVDKLTLVYDDGRRFSVPSEQSQMNYYVKKTALADGRTLEDVVSQSAVKVELGERQRDEIQLNPPQQINPPDEYFFPSGVVATIDREIIGCQGRLIQGNTNVDPNAFTHPVVYTNVATGEKSYFDIDQLPLGTERVSVGRFYFALHPLMYFYCSSITGEIVCWHMIESFQNGALVRATVTQNICFSPHYIPVSNKKILSRLERRLEDFLKLAEQRTR